MCTYTVNKSIMSCDSQLWQWEMCHRYIPNLYCMKASVLASKTVDSQKFGELQRYVQVGRCTLVCEYAINILEDIY